MNLFNKNYGIADSDYTIAVPNWGPLYFQYLKVLVMIIGQAPKLWANYPKLEQSHHFFFNLKILFSSF